jgi:hypothetical protein
MSDNSLIINDTTIYPPYPQVAKCTNFGQLLNKHLTVENRDEFIGKLVCMIIIGREETGYYTGPWEPARYITYIGRIENIRKSYRSGITQIILTDIKTVAADYLSCYHTLTRGTNPIYWDFELLTIARKECTIDLRKFTIPKSYIVDIYDSNPSIDFTPRFYYVPPELSPENLEIRHEQMLSSLEAEYQLDNAVVIAQEKAAAAIALVAKLASQKKAAHQKAMRRNMKGPHRSKKNKKNKKNK